jgi:hypothetical protein
VAEAFHLDLRRLSASSKRTLLHSLPGFHADSLVRRIAAARIRSNP